MITSSYSIHATMVAMPAGPAPSVQPGASAARREEPVTVPAPAPAPANLEGDEAARQARYFEEMVNSAADMLLRTQAAEAYSRFDL